MVAEPIIEFVVRRQQMAEVRRQQREAKAPNVIAGDAKVIDAKMMITNWPAVATRFLSRLRLTTFGDKGRHHNRGEDEHFTEFDLSSWSRDMERTPSQVRRIRESLVKAHIISFVPHPTIPGQGVVGWNMNIDEWQEIGPKGGAHNPLGNPLFHDPEYQAALYTLKAKNSAFRKLDTCQSVPPDLSKDISTLDNEPVKVDKPDCLGVASGAVSQPPQEGSTEEGSRSSDTHVSGDAASAGAPARASPSQKNSSKRTGRSSTQERKPPSRSELDPEGLKIFRAACFKLMRAQSKNFDTLRTAGQAKTLFDNKKHYTVQQVEGCWQETIRDPKYNPTNLLEVKDIAAVITGYLDDPVGYRAIIDDRIATDQWRKQQRERSKHNGQSGRAGHQLSTEPKAGSLAAWEHHWQGKAGVVGGSDASQEPAANSQSPGSGTDSQEPDDEALRRFNLV